MSFSATYLWCASSGLNFTGSSGTSGVTYVWRNMSITPNPTMETGSTTTFTPTPSGTSNFTLNTKLNGCESLPFAMNNVSLKAVPSTPNITSFTYYSSDFNIATNAPASATYTNLPHFNFRNFTLTGTAAIAGETAQWYVDPTLGSSYLAITGATADKFSAVENNSSDGKFVLRHTNSCGYAVSSSVSVTWCASCRVGLEDTDGDLSSVLYPNPTSNELNINSPYDSYTLIVTNLIGSEVFSKQINQSTSKVDLSSLSAGSYVIKMVSPKGTVTKKVQVVK